MLDTLLQIGKTFREAGKDGLKHHRYIKPAPVPDKKTTITFLSLPVREDFSFDFDGIKEIPENERSKLYYLQYKTSDNDNNSFRYVFGDLIYGLDKNGKENEYYHLQKSFNFNTNKPEIKELLLEINGTIIDKFRKSFSINIDKIENVLKKCLPKEKKYIHFDFNGKAWYQIPEVLDILESSLVKKFTKNESHYNGNDIFSFTKSLYRTICSGDAKNDIQFPQFDKSKKYRSVGFTIDDVKNLFYAVNYSEKALITEWDTKSDIKIIVLPKGKNILLDDLEAFSENRISEETLVQLGVDINTYEEFFTSILFGTSQSIVEFDVIFCKTGGQVDSDVLEFPAIQRSFLQDRLNQINQVKSRVQEIRDKEIVAELKPLTLRRSFFNILSDKTSAKKKYQNHLFKVLPQIYTGTYYNDDVLLPAFIEKTEFNIRNDESNYNFLKYDYYFLTQIQNSNTDKIMEMENSPSYKAGLLLGKMAKPLGQGKNPKIASFEKNYVGLLSRRIADKRGLMELANLINQKLLVHDAASYNLQNASVEFASIVSQMNEKEYLKNECAFGFFESYFKYEPKKSEGTETTSSNN